MAYVQMSLCINVLVDMLLRHLETSQLGTREVEMQIVKPPSEVAPVITNDGKSSDGRQERHTSFVILGP